LTHGLMMWYQLPTLLQPATASTSTVFIGVLHLSCHLTASHILGV
jgi:hypothetical protein